MSRARKKQAEMNGNSLGVVLSSGALAGAERSGGERSEPQRSAAPAKAGAGEVRLAPRPDSEVLAATPGGVGALLRREGLYSSLLAYWRRERAAGIREALTPQKRGPKSKRHPLQEENLQLRRQMGQLTEKLRKAEIIIDVQKKVAALLGRPLPDLDPEENS